MKKFGLSLTIGLIAFALIALFKLQPGQQAGLSANSASTANAVSAATEAPQSSTSVTTTATPTPQTTSAGSYKNGTYTGSSVYNGFGPIQVSVTIAGGKISDVKLLQTPSDRRSVEIANYAVPTLVQEAISTQSATVDYVSGATATSDAFMQSLQNALNQA